MKTIKTEKVLYSHTELEKLLNIGQNIINERSKNKKDGTLNRYNKDGNLWKKGDGMKYFEIEEVKEELRLRPYRKNGERQDTKEVKEGGLVLTGQDNLGVLKDIRELLTVLLQGQQVQVKGMLDMRQSLIDMCEAWKK